jgi:hypothetical protein
MVARGVDGDGVGKNHLSSFLIGRISENVVNCLGFDWLLSLGLLDLETLSSLDDDVL